jgi:Zn-dependent protease
VNEWRFELLGFPVRVQPAFAFLLAIYALFSLQARQPIYALVSFSVVVFVSILVHELGHALVARRYRLRVGDIVLHGMGGHVTHSPGSASQSLAISLAGPVAGLCLGLLVWAMVPLLPPNPIVSTVVGDLLWVNIGWSLFNLLPMMPLDGGNALRSALQLRFSRVQSTRWAATTGLVLGVLLAIAGLRFDMIFVLAIGGFSAYQNYQVLQQLPRR